MFHVRIDREPRDGMLFGPTMRIPKSGGVGSENQDTAARILPLRVVLIELAIFEMVESFGANLCNEDRQNC